MSSYQYESVSRCLSRLSDLLDDACSEDSCCKEEIEAILLNLLKWMSMSDVEMQIHLPESTEQERLSIRAILKHISSGDGIQTFRKPL